MIYGPTGAGEGVQTLRPVREPSISSGSFRAELGGTAGTEKTGEQGWAFRKDSGEWLDADGFQQQLQMSNGRKIIRTSSFSFERPEDHSNVHIRSGVFGSF